MTIQAICFDADGVLVNPQKQFSKHLNQAYGISPEMTRPFFEGVFNDCMVGQADLAVVLPPFLKQWGWQASVDQFIQTWLKADHVVDVHLIHAIQSLRHSGIICCLATSQERNRAEYMKSEMGFQDLFDHLFFSCEVGRQKPDHAYFQHIEDTLGLPQHAILFWDDARTNVEAAREFGWNAEVYTDFDGFEKIIKNLALGLNLE